MTFRLLISLLIFTSSLTISAQNTFWGEFEFPSELDLWRGDIDDFIVQNEKLRLYAPDGKNESEIYVPFNFLDKSQWNFTISMDFSPSGSNYTEFILAKDTLTDNKIYCRIGENGSADALELFHNNTSITRVDEGDFSSAFQNEKLEIKYEAGQWEIKTKRSGIMVEYPLSFDDFNAFSIQCNYSKTRSDLFYFDSLYVYSEEIKDTIGPQILNIKFNSSGKHLIEFNEAIQEVASFSVNGTSPLYSSINESKLEFQLLEDKKELQFQIDVTDQSGNKRLIDSSLKTPFITKGSLLITELMVDPEPTLFLPNSEYIELFNPTPSSIHLENWTITDASLNKRDIPKTELKSKETLILVPQGNSLLFPDSISLVEIVNFPSLNNTNDIISLYDSNDVLIHQMNYNTSVFNNLSDGGKSLELLNSENACFFNSVTWQESKAFKGGSPGVFNNLEAENNNSLINGEIKDNTIQISLAPYGSSYFLNHAILKENELATYNWLAEDTLELIFKHNIQSGEIINLDLCYLDCQLNKVQTVENFLIPEVLKTGDVKINEFLINGKESIDFIEFKNTSNRPILSNQIVLTQLEEGEIVKSWKAENGIIISPGELWVWSPSLQLLEENYFVKKPERTQEVKIALTEDIELGLYSSEGAFLDQLKTNIINPKNWLNSPEDASWERLSTDMPTNNSETWAPATEFTEWASPTATNTQNRTENHEKEYEVKNRIIRTNSRDPKEQQIEIIFHPNDSKTYVNATVFNRNGQSVKTLVSNRLLASEDRIFWNGKDDNNQLLATNVYLVYLEIYSLNGEIEVKKESVVID